MAGQREGRVPGRRVCRTRRDNEKLISWCDNEKLQLISCLACYREGAYVEPGGQRHAPVDPHSPRRRRGKKEPAGSDAFMAASVDCLRVPQTSQHMACWRYACWRYSRQWGGIDCLRVPLANQHSRGQLEPAGERGLLPVSQAPLLPVSQGPLLPVSQGPLLPVSQGPRCTALESAAQHLIRRRVNDHDDRH